MKEVYVFWRLYIITPMFVVLKQEHPPQVTKAYYKSCMDLKLSVL